MTMTTEQAERVLDGIDALQRQHGEILSRMADLGNRVEHAAEKAETAHRIVLGNGSPENGLAMRVKGLEKDSERTSKVLTWGGAIVFGVMLLRFGTWLADRLGIGLPS
jgi:hypothetical protein